jgi:hypothetical protein
VGRVYPANGPCRHGMEMKRAVSCRRAGTEAKPGHGPVAFKWVMPRRWPVRPYRAYKICLFFSHKFNDFNKNNYLMSLNLKLKNMISH